MKFSVEVGLGPSHIVLDGDPGPLPKKGHSSPPLLAHDYCGQTSRWIQDATWYEGRPGPRPHCVRWGSSFPPPEKGHSPPIFVSCLLWPNGHPSQLLLSIC